MITQLESQGLIFAPFTDELLPKVESINTILDQDCFTWAGLLNHKVRNRSIEQWQTEFKRGLGFYAIRRQVDDLIIGQGGLSLDQGRVNIGYVIAKPYWGRKIAENVVVTLLRYGFERLGENEIWASTQTDYWAGWRVLETLGMTYQYEDITDRGRVHYYALSRDAFYWQRRTKQMMKGKKYIQNVLA